MKRIALGFVWFIVFWLGIGPIVGAVIVGTAVNNEQTPSSQQGSSDTYEAGKKAGYKAGPFILLGSLVLAVAGTAFGVLPGTKPRKKVETNEQ